MSSTQTNEREPLLQSTDEEGSNSSSVTKVARDNIQQLGNISLFISLLVDAIPGWSRLN